MAHYPKPFFRASRGVWYVQINGKQINLGPDKHAAFKAYHAEMQRRVETPASIHPTAAKLLVVVVVDEYLDWCEKHRAPDTYRWYKDRLESFCKTIEATLTVDQLRPHHVQKWVDNYAVPLKSGSRRNLIASVKRAMKWAEEQGYIDHSRIAHMKKPGCGRKEQIVTPEQFTALLDRYWRPRERTSVPRDDCNDDAFECATGRAILMKPTDDGIAITFDEDQLAVDCFELARRRDQRPVHNED